MAGKTLASCSSSHMDLQQAKSGIEGQLVLHPQFTWQLSSKQPWDPMMLLTPILMPTHVSHGC